MNENTTTSTDQNEIETVQVPISRGYFVTIDKDDYERVTQWKWTALPTKWTVYARRGVKRNGKQYSLYLHRFIMGEPEGLEVDHRDCNGLNNSKKNLRVSDDTQQNCNQRIHRKSFSGIKGVGWNKAAGKWQAYIGLNKKFIHLGLFKTKEEAAAARRTAATILHKDFCRHE